MGDGSVGCTMLGTTHRQTWGHPSRQNGYYAMPRILQALTRHICPQIMDKIHLLHGKDYAIKHGIQRAWMNPIINKYHGLKANISILAHSMLLDSFSSI